MLKKQIHNPYKVNWKLYGLIGAASVLVMIAAVEQNAATGSIASDIIKNLAFGCVASTLVAWLIEIGNIKEKNENANNLYTMVYADLKSRVRWYLHTWVRLCSFAYNDGNYQGEKHTWTEWYELTKNRFLGCDADTQAELMHFFRDQLAASVDSALKATRQIINQKHLLNINGLYDENLREILDDFDFEFEAAKSTLDRDCGANDFWRTFDAINQDLENYIHNWVDIRYYNYYKFELSDFLGSEAETLRAMQESKQAERAAFS